MALWRTVRNDPWEDFRRLQEQMGRFPSPFGTRPLSARVFPAVNLYDNGEAFFIQAEIPGASPEDLEITATADTLTIGGSIKSAEPPEGASYHRRERNRGEFRRSISLPERIDSSKVNATLKNGVLTVEVHRAEEVKPRKISIQAK